VNTKVAKMIHTILEAAYPLVPAADIVNFTDHETSVTFHNISYPDPHTWSASDTTDSTIILLAQPVIGWPRSLTSDPSKPRRLHFPPGLPWEGPGQIHPLFG
jgi:hypothetical protein